MKWKLVPVEITEQMHVAAVKVLIRANGIAFTPQRMFDAMLAAAPQPEPLSDERIYQVWGEQAEKTIGKIHSEFLVSFVRAIEREIFGGEA